MIRLGITGGIGSGKSYVAALLVQRGMPLYDTDSRAKQLAVSHPLIRKGLADLLGKEVYAPDGSLNKPLLASYLFFGEANARKVNSIIHPCVFNDFLHWAESLERKGCLLAGMESAILFESGFDRAVDKVLAVWAPETLRIRRAMERDNAAEVQVRARMAAQDSDEEKRRKADFVVVNDGDAPLAPQIDRILLSLVGRKELR